MHHTGEADLTVPHAVLSCKANWSHLRSLCILAARLVTVDSLAVTILVAHVQNEVPRMETEISRSLGNDSEVKHNIRVVGLFSDLRDDAALAQSFTRTWNALVHGEDVCCAYRTSLSLRLPRPTVVVLDGFQLPFLEIIRATSPTPPIFQWLMAFSAGVLYMCGPSDLGGREGMYSSTGLALGDQVRIPGMPVMIFDDLHPQDLGDKEVKIGVAIRNMTEFLQRADGLLTMSALECDSKECLDSLSTWFSGPSNRPIFHLGPMLPLLPGTQQLPRSAISAEITSTPGGHGQQALDFLEKSLAISGENSVFYISFGTEHWPIYVEHIEVLLDSLELKRIPFIFAYAHPSAWLPPLARKRLEDSGQGIFLPFAPQQTILSHSACGWFLTHGGANGTVESLSQGVPMIGWPFGIDQPLNVAFLARTLHVAFELKAVKSPLSAKDSLVAIRAELDLVLDLARSDDGGRKRYNAQQIGKRIGSAWSKDSGRAREEILRFVALLKSSYI